MAAYLHDYELNDGRRMILCTEHKKSVADQITVDNGQVTGGKWRCKVCTMVRQFDGGMEEPDAKFRYGHWIIRYPDGVTMCDCPAWRFMPLPPKDRVCKHIEALSYAEA